MKPENKGRTFGKIRFSIGAKLITIISIIILISLGSITALVSWLVRGDLRMTAEENNFETNRRSALEAEITLAHVRFDARMLMQTINASKEESAQESTDFFFEESPQIAALILFVPGRPDRLLINEKFFQKREIDRELAGSFFQNHRAALERSAWGENIILNAAPHFSRPLLALFFPWKGGGAGSVLFSSESLNENFGIVTNRSYMINSDGDILAHADFEMLRSGANIGDQRFIRSILESSERSKQELIEPESTENAESPKNRTWSLLSVLRGAGGPERQFTAYTKLNTAGAVVITSIEYDKVFEGIAATTRRNIYLTAAVLSISIALIWVFSKSISVPLRTLAAAARKIESGNFELELKLKGRDEIGLLAASFRSMCTALGIFGRFTNRDIAIKAMSGEIRPGGFPKHATIFFSDIRDFTAKSENFTKTFGDQASDRIVHWLNDYFTQMVNCVEKTGGVVDKFIGDAVMAHWGTAYTAGSPRKDAFNSVKAALMMRLTLIRMNKGRETSDTGNPPIRIGCGINTGIVTAGQIGSDLRMEYTVIGDPVNLASRIEALTKPLGVDILITEDTWLLIRDKFIVEEMPPVTVAGKQKPVRIFAVVNLTGTTGPKTLNEVRKILGIVPPDMSKVDVNANEIKYKIGK